MTTPDPTLAARLAELQINATDEDLHEEGRYFDGCHSDLTQCPHGDTGNYSCRHDGPLIAALWNAYRAGQLITTAEADARVEAAVLAERAACAWTATSFLSGDPKNGIPLRSPTAHEVADAIRARGGKP